MFRYIKSFIKALNANSHPGDIAHAVAAGLLLALVPKSNLLWIALFVLFMLIRMNKGAFFLSLILFSLGVPILDTPLELAGYAFLSIPALYPFFETLYQTPFVGLTRFNNSMVMGGFLAGLLLYIPVYFLFTALIKAYRNKLHNKIVNSKLYKIFLNLPLIKQIANAPDLGGIHS